MFGEGIPRHFLIFGLFSHTFGDRPLPFVDLFQRVDCLARPFGSNGIGDNRESLVLDLLTMKLYVNDRASISLSPLSSINTSHHFATATIWLV
jgi:hypothetical protein